MKPGVLPVKGLPYYRGGDQAHRIPAPSTGLSGALHDDATGERLINGLYRLVDELPPNPATPNLSRPAARLPSNARRPGEPKER